MLINLHKKSLVTLYITVVRPCYILAQSMSGSVDANKYSVGYVTVPSVEVGNTIARGLVENKLAACVNIIPQITSIYEWEGKITEDSEALLMIKTRTSEADKLTEYVRNNHPYKVCEVITLPIQNGNPGYLSWIGDIVPDTSPPKEETEPVDEGKKRPSEVSKNGRRESQSARSEEVKNIPTTECPSAPTTESPSGPNTESPSAPTTESQSGQSEEAKSASTTEVTSGFTTIESKSATTTETVTAVESKTDASEIVGGPKAKEIGHCGGPTCKN
ncbi:uncharacterized protein LOC113500622 [Trichoplusia ni]|uniref:Uncharacterized protein LOC113500622 n=1 Tax=Trichoplusia ni TaxID=7111 RepID=A0A7E5WAQ2_TRINI|nr:uncharacterized protein LOC113500622 [Trichoplusia ni]